MAFFRSVGAAGKRAIRRAADFKRRRPNAFVAACAAAIVAIVAAGWGVHWASQPRGMSLTRLLEAIESRQVERAEILTNNLAYGVTATIGGETYYTRAPLSYIDKAEDGKEGTNIVQLLKASGAEITMVTGAMETLAVLVTVFTPAVIIVLLVFMAAAMVKDSTTSWMTVSRKIDTRFRDVAGADEAKEEIAEVLSFLTDGAPPAAGVRTPRGVLLSGQPGTGKTLLAKALAGEAGTSFIAVSGSDFKSMWFGGSQRRVSSLFRHARNNRPCVVFIDEFDAIGAKRASGGDAISKENNGMLNQLLVEMDGFENNDGVLVVAATNLAADLDPAVKRPGRMDRIIEVAPPDLKGRTEILKVHTRGIRLSDDTDLTVVARGIPGFVGADIANLVNEAAIQALRDGRERVEAGDFDKAKNRIVMGLERRTLTVTEEERRLTAYHEAGHALAASLCRHSDPVHRATIVPHGRALGMVVRLPERDRVSVTAAKLRDDLVVAMAGRAAEKAVFGADQVTTGAEADIEHATKFATAMVTRWGMSERIGLVAVDDERARRDPVVASEIRRLIEESFETALSLMKSNRSELDSLAAALLLNETLTGEEVRGIALSADRTTAAPDPAT